jgi:hypothetical protein
MARIIDKDTRIIDIDFGMVVPTLTRAVGDATAGTVTFTENGVDQMISSIPGGNLRVGSFIQYERVDLSFMTENNEVMQPVNVNVQRTSPVPLGGSNNGNNFDHIEEFIYVLTRPLNNENLFALGVPSYGTVYNPLRTLGLDSAAILAGGNPALGGLNSGWPNQAECIFAEKRMYSVNLSMAATVANGSLPNGPAEDPPAPLIYNTLTGTPSLDSVSTWGSMEAITGPNLHVYRVVIIPSQDFGFVPNLTVNQTLGGIASYLFPPVNVSFLCKDPNYTEGEYLTRIANAMNSTPEGGPTA